MLFLMYPLVIVFLVSWLIPRVRCILLKLYFSALSRTHIQCYKYPGGTCPSSCLCRTYGLRHKFAAKHVVAFAEGHLIDFWWFSMHSDIFIWWGVMLLSLTAVLHVCCNYTVSKKKVSQNVFVIFSTKLCQFWYKLVRSVLNKFATKYCKVFHLTWIVSVHYLVKLCHFCGNSYAGKLQPCPSKK